ncbi:MAG: Spo0E family sporulation regulatory protein-aspartic acid phosphatase [Clostridia bacterium]|nr:Spo0E family sporulation regulatory protein-aspartic acid phosphatase [Clostridia bacterium]
MQIEKLREEFDNFLASKNFDLTDEEVIKRANELEKKIYESHA